MITERPILERFSVHVTVDRYGAGVYGEGVFGEVVAEDLAPYLTGVRIRRGGTRNALGIKTDVGLMTLTLRNVYDPLSGGHLFPGMSVTAAIDGISVFTGSIASVESDYPMDKRTGRAASVVTVTVADAVSEHTKTPRYGVRTEAGFETFEDRINRLATSARTPVDAPELNAPREVYAL